MVGQRLFQCDARNCHTTHTTERAAFKHAITTHYLRLPRYPGDYPCFVDECPRIFPSPFALERHYTTKHPPPNPKRFPLPDLFPPRDLMLPVRATLLYHVCPVPQTPVHQPGSCPSCSSPRFPSDTELARHVYRYHPGDRVALKAVAHVPSTPCRTCPQRPMLFSLAGLIRHYAAEHKGLRVKLDETKPLLRSVSVRDALLRVRAQRERWAKKAAMKGTLHEGTEVVRDGNVSGLCETKNEREFEGVGQGELGVCSRMEVVTAKRARRVEREGDHW